MSLCLRMDSFFHHHWAILLLTLFRLGGGGVHMAHWILILNFNPLILKIMPSDFLTFPKYALGHLRANKKIMKKSLIRGDTQHYVFEKSPNRFMVKQDQFPKKGNHCHCKIQFIPDISTL